MPLSCFAGIPPTRNIIYAQNRIKMMVRNNKQPQRNATATQRNRNATQPQRNRNRNQRT
jgi:hypothetical protein